jgi:hypothetical protein
LVAGDGEPSLAIVDWQLTIGGRPVLDLARFLVGYVGTAGRRREEDRLLQIYHSVLTERGVTDYSLERAGMTIAMALVLTASRLATGVGLHPGVTPTPGGFWNVVFPHYARPRRRPTPPAALRLVAGVRFVRFSPQRYWLRATVPGW